MTDGRLGRLRGFEWRVSRVGCLVFGLAAAAFVGWLAVGVTVTARTVFGGVALAAVVATLDDDRPPVRATSAVAVVLAGMLAASSLSTTMAAYEVDRVAGGVLALTLGGLFAIGISSVPIVTGRDRLTPRRFLGSLWPIGTGITLLALTVVPNAEATAAVLGVTGGVTDGLLAVVLGRDSHGVFVVPVLVLAASWALRRTISRLPIAAAVPKQRQDGVTAALASVERGCRVGQHAGVGLLAGVVLVRITVADGSTTGDVFEFAPDVVATAATALLSTAPLRLVLVSILVCSAVAWLNVYAIGWVHRTSAEHAVRCGAPAIGGIVVVLALSMYIRWYGGVEAVSPETADWLASFLFVVGPTGTAAVVLALAGTFVVVLFGTLRVLGTLTLPKADRAPALASSGAFALAIVALALGWTVSGFVAAGLAMACWDAGVYARSVADGLPNGRTTRAELAHVSATLAVGGFVVAVAVMAAGALGLLPTLSPTAGRMLAASLVGVGTILLLIKL